MPNCWTLMRRLFNLRSFNGSSSFNTRSRTNTNGYISAKVAGSKNVGSTVTRTPHGRNDREEGNREAGWWEREARMTRLGKTESEEHIVGAPSKAKLMPLEIWESKEFDVDRGSIRAAGFDRTGLQPRIYDGVGGNSAQEFVSKTTVTVRAGSVKSGYETRM